MVENQPVQMKEKEMARSAKFILALAAVLSFVSCATVSIESNKDPANSEVINRIYVVVDTGDWKWDAETLLGDYLARNLEKKLQENGIDTRARRLTGLELNEDQLKREVDDFGTTKIMEVRLTDGIVDKYKNLVQSTYDISIQDTSKNTKIWRAKVTDEGGMDVDKVIDSIISGLLTDGLITAPVAPTKSN